MRIRTLLLIIIAAAVAAAAVTVSVAVYRLKTRRLPAENTVEIPYGTGTRQIGSILESAGIIDSGIEFVIWTRILGEDCNLEAGVYDFAEPVSLNDVIARLSEGVPGPERSFTIPEGLTIKETADILFGEAPGKHAVFIDLAETPGPDLRLLAGIEEGSLEGYLFPDTYRFHEPLDPLKVIRIMLENRTAKVTPEMWKKADSSAMSMTGAVILASIIEEEAVLDEERPLISAVYRNRLRLGWKLEADPTVAYALGKKGSKLTTRDLKIDSPYNTYTRKGLPPGPICSPGLASLHAALFPAPDREVLYFVASGDGGGHIFSSTWADHKKAVRKYRLYQRTRLKSES